MKEKFNSFIVTACALAEFATFSTQNITGLDAGLGGKF